MLTGLLLLGPIPAKVDETATPKGPDGTQARKSRPTATCQVAGLALFIFSELGLCKIFFHWRACCYGKGRVSDGKLAAAWQATVEGHLAALPGPRPAPAVCPTQFLILVTCRDERQQVELLERLGDEGLECKALLS